MTVAHPTRTPIGRLDNSSDRIAALRERVHSMAYRGHLNATLGGDLQAVRRLLDRLERDLNQSRGRVHTIATSGDEIEAEANRIVYELVRAQEPWLNYAAARLGAANIAYLALGREA